MTCIVRQITGVVSEITGFRQDLRPAFAAQSAPVPIACCIRATSWIDEFLRKVPYDGVQDCAATLYLCSGESFGEQGMSIPG